MKKNTEAKESTQATENPVQLLYADRIISFALGPAVTKLTLGMEVNLNTYTPITTLVIPTISLIESLSFIQGSIAQDEEMKLKLVQGIDAIKERFKKL